jgi:hypothetical protein
MSTDLSKKKISTELKTAAFTEHNTVVFKIKHGHTATSWGRGYWKLNSTLLKGDAIKEEFQEKCNSWKTKKNRYQNTQQWWGKYAKREIQWFFRREGKQRAQDQRSKGEFYHACINELLEKPPEDPQVNEKIKYFKANIIRLHGKQMETLKANLSETDIIHDEQPALYHVIKVHTRRKKKLIMATLHQEGRRVDTRHEIQERFRRELQTKFEQITIDEENAERYTPL